MFSGGGSAGDGCASDSSPARATSTSTVGLPRESMISRPRTSIISISFMIIRFLFVLFRQGNMLSRSGEACHVPRSSGFKSRTDAERGTKLAGFFRAMMPRRMKGFPCWASACPVLGILPGRSSGESGRTGCRRGAWTLKRAGAAAFARRKLRQGKLRRFVTQGRTACRNGALIPSRSGYGMRRLLLKPCLTLTITSSSCRRDICSRK